MKISGFTYVRNGFAYGYPFLAAIQSLLPLVDELVVVVGDSLDGTREAIVNLQQPKIKIIDAVWDEQLRKEGKIFALQSNIGLTNVSGDWAFHIQADEVLHEQDYAKINASIIEANSTEDIDGILFPFLHFWGDYRHVRNTRKVHPFEIRAFKRRGIIKAYKDSQGFRIYSSEAGYENGESGKKLRVIAVDAPVYHYSYTRNPFLMKKKDAYFNKFWHEDEWFKHQPNADKFDFNAVDALELFKGSHPACMQDIIAAQDWEFMYNPKLSNMSFKDKIINRLNRITGKRWFEYQNYILSK